MAAYLVVDTLLDNPELYEEYKRLARPLAERFGGEYLARGGEMTLKETDLWSPTRLVLVRFPDAQSANSFYDSPEYQDVLKISKQSARRTVVVLEGLRGADDAQRIARRLVDALSRPYDIDGLVLHLGVSVGISLGGSAPDADAAAFPLNKAVLFTKIDAAIGKAGTQGTLARALTGAPG